MQTKDAFKNSTRQHIGPGGWRCACCGPAPKERKRFRRATRSRLHAETRKLIREAVA